MRNVHLECKVCRKVFQDFHVAEEHRKECSRKHSVSHFCTLCGSQFSSQLELDLHVASAHRDEDGSPVTVKSTEPDGLSISRQIEDMVTTESSGSSDKGEEADETKDEESAEPYLMDDNEFLELYAPPGTDGESLVEQRHEEERDSVETNHLEDSEKEDSTASTLWEYAEKYINISGVKPNCKFCHKKFSQLRTAVDHVLVTHLRCEYCFGIFANRGLTMAHRKLCKEADAAKKKKKSKQDGKRQQQPSVDATVPSPLNNRGKNTNDYSLNFLCKGSITITPISMIYFLQVTSDFRRI